MSHHLKPIINKLSAEGRAVLDAAVSHAVSLQHTEVTPEHLLMAILRQQSPLIEQLGLQSGLPVSRLFEVLQQELQHQRPQQNSAPHFSVVLTEWFIAGWLLASSHWGQSQLTPAALLAALFDDGNALRFATPVEKALQCDRPKALALLQSIYAPAPARDEQPAASTSALQKYTRNLSELARKGELDPVLGRESELRQMVDILLRRRQNNPILTGEPGVGKTALAEALAMRIVAGTFPQMLESTEILTLDLGLLQAGASVKGEFENRLQQLLKEVARAPTPIILFIDEAHTLIGAGGSAGQSDAANLLKPALARGELRIIAATTWAEYKKYFEKDAALARRFQLIKVAEPDTDKATTMLRAMAPAMSRHHGIPILESAIHAAISLSSRYIAERQLPDKSVSLLDTACARVAISQTQEPKEIEAICVQLRAIECEIAALKRENSAPERREKLRQQATNLQSALDSLRQEWDRQTLLVQQLQQSQDAEEITRMREALAACHQQHAMVFECVDAACVADVVADWTGIPLGHMLEQEHQQLDTLCERLEQRIIGQRHALKHITQQIRISRAGLADPQKPTGVYMLAGPSGIGKTETSLALAELLYGGEKSMVTINMSEYQEAHSVSGLKGSPPGYVGYGQGGVLTEAVRRNPYCVVLLDEVEKAHPDVMELFYQIFDKGIIEDAEGQMINFRNTLIIMTSNLASAALISAWEKGKTSPEALCNIIRPEFERVFSPALMGRMTLIPYLPLQPQELAQIIELKLQHLCRRYQTATESDSRPGWTNKVVNWVAKRCQVQQSGARDIDQILTSHLLPVLANHALTPAAKNEVKIDILKDQLVLKV
ncbi:type VI secretion system protein VasG [Kosakonia radicincitans]|uniref:type VI secretion system ATPase TssH n=1 Tax=Kosakonia radicincitans TaxID=283686 RepID=UPI0009A802EE|nr:type VI secretion system ATPase TssH [Kosakonia radicincitans]SKC21502.1 type VI secretion system protein VasG [Kosakonia radicincitans]